MNINHLIILLLTCFTYSCAPKIQRFSYQNYPPQQYYVEQPGSRSYSNPYAIPPSPSYNNYDVDHYYVPPSNYSGEERHHNPGGYEAELHEEPDRH